MHQLIKNNKVGLNLFIPKKYNLENINQALSDLQHGKAFRPLIEMEHCE
jgi:Zn-dependent alcohol dehydrogenase